MNDTNKQKIKSEKIINSEIVGGNKIIYNGANNKGVSDIAMLCTDIADVIYNIKDNFYHKIPDPFDVIDKINLINNRIFKYKDSLKIFWKQNEAIDKIFIEKTKRDQLYSGKIYGRFNDLYIDNKYFFKDKENFGDLIIDFVIEKIDEQIKNSHNLKEHPVDDLALGVRGLTFHAFYKCKILENPNDS